MNNRNHTCVLVATCYLLTTCSTSGEVMKVFPMEDQKDLIHLIATLKSPAEKSLQKRQRCKIK